jgi:hypothetical protein
MAPMSLAAGGKLRLLRPGVLEHWCPGCGQVHAIDVHATSGNGRVIGWDGDVKAPTFGEPLLHNTEHGTCEYVLRSGVMYFLSNCWHPLAGQSRHLQEFPR